MNPRLFAFLVGCSVAFVWLTSYQLPSVVASHFDGSGMANGFMPHRSYVSLMLALLVGLPTLLVVITWWSLGSSNARINLPNKDYWLAPERRRATVSYLRSGVLWFGTLLLVFLCYSHWLVVLANGQQPAKLHNSWFIGGLVAFLAILLIWLKVFLGHFRRSA
jgi:uncharacterized membrane protein